MALLGVTAAAAAGLALLQVAPNAARTNTATTATPASAVVPPTRVGINLSGLFYYAAERPFSNLAAVGQWRTAGPGANIDPIEPRYLDQNGYPSIWPTNQIDGRNLVSTFLLPPTPLPTEPIVCTWTGKAEVNVHGTAIADVKSGNRRLSFRLIKTAGVWITVRQSDPANPLQNLDCREESRPRDMVFDPAFIDMVKGFDTLRFMDWQWVNANDPVTWETRKTPQFIFQRGGTAIEYIVALAKEAGVNPWVTMPFTADENYVRGFATYVHDHLPPDRTVYVELGNEIWNTAFPAAKQSQAEGLAAGLSTDPTTAQMLNYARRSAQVFDIWLAVFADRPDKLVRVVSTQNVSPRTAEMVLGYPGLKGKVDALATAPYFYINNPAAKVTGDNLDDLFAALETSIDQSIDYAAQNKAIATRHGVRYIAYEAGQHLVFYGKKPLQEAVQRDPRMGQLYARYLSEWQRRIGDLIVLFASSATIGDGGAWGLREYQGQPLSEAPKAEAVDRFIKSLGDTAGSAGGRP